MIVHFALAIRLLEDTTTNVFTQGHRQKAGELRRRSEKSSDLSAAISDTRSEAIHRARNTGRWKLSTQLIRRAGLSLKGRNDILP